MQLELHPNYMELTNVMRIFLDAVWLKPLEDFDFLWKAYFFS